VKKGYNASFDARAYLKALRTMPVDIAVDVGKLFKVLPSPNYDIGSS
jgi:hypothetical protein